MERFEKVRSLYEAVKDRFYLGDELLVCQERYEPVVLFGVITLLFQTFP